MKINGIYGYVHLWPIPTQLMRIMKLTTLIITICILQVSASTKAQITLKENKASLEKVLEKIGKQSGYDFIYSKQDFKEAEKLSINLDNVSVETALEVCFSNQPLTYEISDRTVMVKLKKGKSILDQVIDYFTDIDVTGKIVDEKGEAIAGATIKVKGTAIQTNSGSDGSFSLKNVADNSILEITYIGFQTKEIRVLKQLGTITLQVSIGKLEEVTINAGYYTVKQQELTGSISKITSKDIENQPVTNVLATMQGRMAGVSIIQETGLPGGGFDIKIRGQNSMRSNGNSPLYIIDGVPYASDPIGNTNTSTVFPGFNTSPLNNISQDNIESIEVLKDADATSIYGSKGANGVVLISTKQGKAGKTKLNANFSSGFGQVTRFMKFMNTEEYLSMRKQAFANDKITTYPASAFDINGTWDQNRYTNWQKELLGGTSKVNLFQASVSGGGAQTQFLFGGNYHTETTVFPGEFIYKKGGAQLNLNHKSADNKFKLVLTAGYNLQDNDQPASDLSATVKSLSPNAPALYDANGNLNWEKNTWLNPLSNLGSKFEMQSAGLVTSAVASFELFSGLTLKSNFGYTNLDNKETRIIPHTIYNPAANQTSANSVSFLNNTKRNSWIVEPQLNWERQLGSGKLNLLIGSTLQSQSNNSLVQSGTGFSSNSLIYNLGSATTARVNSSDKSIYKYQAFFGRINYNLHDRYIVNLTGRRDGSSRFGPEKQFTAFGAIGAAWLFSKEKFMNNFSWLSFGKVRTSFGITGNDQIGDYQFLDTYTSSGILYDGNVGLRPSRLYNANFGWETNRKFELAMELGLFEDRIFATGSWYKNRSSNQLVGIPLAGTTGFASLQANLDATVENSGVEFTIKSENLAQRKFKWSTSFNITQSKNKLIRFPGLSTSSYSQQYRIGMPLNIKLLYQYKGINPQTGVYEFFDLNNDGRISNPEDRQVAVDMNPAFFGGIQNQFTYKSLKLDFLFQFVKQKNVDYALRYAGQMVNQPIRMIDSWQQPGSGGRYQIYTTGLNSAAVTAASLYNSSTASINDASYIRLKNVALSYTLPLRFKDSKWEISLQGQNLLTFTKYQDGDPEFLFAGYLPPLKVITAGIKLTL
jgi:TonB-linked SusC/RagA family outer membrane protein